MNNSFAIIGGDLRLINLAKMISKDNKVYIYGQEKLEDFLSKEDNLIICNSLEEVMKNSRIIVSSIPFSKDGIDIYAPFSSSSIRINDLVDYLNDKIFFAGSIQEYFYQLVIDNKKLKIVDLMKEEDLTILNTIATAEGTILEIIQNTDINIHGSKILILGFGRVAKVLAKKLLALDAKVICAARKDRDFAWMEALGLEKTNINNLGDNLRQYDVIINTVPKLILDKNRLQNVRKDTLLIDLASKPGGINQIACKELGLKSIWALAIPGKVAPVTSAIYIKNTIYKILNKEEGN